MNWTMIIDIVTDMLEYVVLSDNDKNKLWNRLLMITTLFMVLAIIGLAAYVFILCSVQFGMMNVF